MIILEKKLSDGLQMVFPLLDKIRLKLTESKKKKIFYESKCTSCHTPKYVTSKNAKHDFLKYQLIWPYTDLLLHDMGDELADKDIAVNAVTPAGAKTRILDQMSKEHVKRMLSKVPRGRFLEIHEFTSLVCWLSSQENTFSTAAVFDISGGRSTY